MAQTLEDSNNATPASAGVVSDNAKTSGVGELYFGRFNTESFLPFYEQEKVENEAGDALVGSIKEFCEQYVFPDRIDSESLLAPGILKGLGERGVLGASVDKSRGGTGGTFFNFCRAMQTLGGFCGSTAEAVNLHSTAIELLLKFGSQSQMEQWVPGLTSGEISVAIAVTEPQSGMATGTLCTVAKSDSAQTNATPESSGFIIDGEKCWISNAPIADLFIVLASTPENAVGDHASTTAFLLTPELTGVTVTEETADKLGMRGITVGGLQFEDVSVTAQEVLGSVGDGTEIIAAINQSSQIGYAASMLGAGKFLLQQMISRARFRRQSGRLIRDFELVREKIASAAANLFALESAIEHVAAHVDLDEEPVADEAMMLKLAADRSLSKIVSDAMDIWGGKSVFTDQALERVFRDVRYNQISSGVGEVIGQQLIARGLAYIASDLKTLSSNWWQAPAKLYVGTPVIPVKHEHLRFNSRWLGSQIGKFGWALKTAIASHGKELTTQQLNCRRLSEIATGLFLSSCVYSRLAATLANGTIPEPAQQADFVTGNLFLLKTRDANERRFDELKISHDELVNSVAEIWLQKTFDDQPIAD